MSLLMKLGIDKYTVKLKDWVNQKLNTISFVPGSGTNSIVHFDSWSVASGHNSVSMNGIRSFRYHIGESDERLIYVPNPTTASGMASVAEGIGTIASGVGSHAEGNVAITHDFFNEETEEWEQTIIVTEASGRGAHAEGLGTKSTKSGSHSEGIGTEVNGNSGHGEGYYTKVHSGEGTHTEGMYTDGVGNGAHAEGYSTFAKGTAAHAEGRGGVATEYGAHVEGGYLKEGDVKLTIERQDDPDLFRYKITSPSSPNIIAGLGCNLRDGSHVIIEEYQGGDELYLSKEVEDGTYIFSNVASGTSSHSEGALNVASGKAAHAEGLKNVASGPSSHVEGESNVSGGDCSHVEGYLNETNETGVHIEGKNNSSDAIYAHVEGINNTIIGPYSHVEGVGASAIVTLKSATKESTLYEIQEDKPEWLADNDRVWIDGFGELIIKKVYSGDSKWINLPRKLGIGNKATISAVIYPEGRDRLTRANAIGSHVEGIGTKTENIGESAVGRFNESDSDTLFSIGIGTSDTDRKNAFEVKENGDIYIEGFEKPIQQELTELSEEVGKKVDSDKVATINGKSLLNGGNIKIEGGSGGADSPIGYGEAENSAIFNGEVQTILGTYKNRAISQTAIALGGNTISGLKGYYITYIDFDSNEIWVHNERPQSDLKVTFEWEKKASTDANKVLYSAGIVGYGSDVISIICKDRYYNCGGIDRISGNKIVLKESLPFTQTDVDEILELNNSISNINRYDELTLFVISKPYVGPVDLGGTSLAEGLDSKAIGGTSHAEGYQTIAYGKYAHTEGYQTEAGYRAHAEGYMSKASGENSHTEGRENKSIGNCSHSEGRETSAVGNFSHTEGYKTTAYGGASHAEGSSTEAGENAHSEGLRTKATGDNSHAEGQETQATGARSHAEGKLTVASGDASHSEGQETQAIGIASHAEGVKTITNTDAWASHVEGYNCETGGNAETNDKEADEDNIEGQMAHAEGNSTIARGNASHAEGTKTIAVGKCSHAEGYLTKAIGASAHAEGEGNSTEAVCSHIEGYSNKIYKNDADSSHAEGENNIVNDGAYASHVEGEYNQVNNRAEHASGQYNKSTKSDVKSQATHFSIGIGTSNDDRKNAFEVKQNGDIYIEGVEGRIQDKLNGGGSAGKSQFQIYKENGGSFYETEEQYNLYTILKNDPGKITSTIYGPLTRGNYTWSDYEITPKMVAKWIYNKIFWINYEDSFTITIVDSDLDDFEKTASSVEFNDGVIVLKYTRGDVIYINLDGSVNVELN